MTQGERNKLVHRGFALALLALVGMGGAPAWGQFNEREVPKRINVEDKDDIHKEDSKIWVLDFTFKDPRIITVDIPGRGKQICWYVRYWVTNNTKQPIPFIPKFELVALDKPAVYVDEVLPSVEKAIRQIEDPTGYQNIKNSVTISAQPIPTSQPNAPVVVSGVAIWTGVNPDATRFSIFVSGLSNGWSIAEIPPDNKQVVRRKTLQLNFKRLGDRYYQRSGDIQYVPPFEWVYRGSSVTLPGANPPVAPAKTGAAQAPVLGSVVPEKTTSKR
jgi:hypothetical protein